MYETVRDVIEFMALIAKALLSLAVAAGGLYGIYWIVKLPRDDDQSPK